MFYYVAASSTTATTTTTTSSESSNAPVYPRGSDTKIFKQWQGDSLSQAEFERKVLVQKPIKLVFLSLSLK
jgi:hypothetical protein